MKELIEGECIALSLEILLAISLLMVLIYFALIPTLEPIRRPQKNLARARPMINFLIVWRVQLSARVWSVMQSTIGCGPKLIFCVANTMSDAQ
jgi:hypothetical protein